MVPRAARSGDVVAWYVCGPEGEVDVYRLVVGGDFALQRVSGAGQNRSGNERSKCSEQTYLLHDTFCVPQMPMSSTYDQRSADSTAGWTLLTSHEDIAVQRAPHTYLVFPTHSPRSCDPAIVCSPTVSFDCAVVGRRTLGWRAGLYARLWCLAKGSFK